MILIKIWHEKNDESYLQKKKSKRKPIFSFSSFPKNLFFFFFFKSTFRLQIKFLISIILWLIVDREMKQFLYTESTIPFSYISHRVFHQPLSIFFIIIIWTAKNPPKRSKTEPYTPTKAGQSRAPNPQAEHSSSRPCLSLLFFELHLSDNYGALSFRLLL